MHKRKKFVVMVPVEFTIEDVTELPFLLEELQASGGSMDSSDGTSFNIRTDKVKLSDMRRAITSRRLK